MSNYTNISFNTNKGAALELQAFEHGVTSNINIYLITLYKVPMLRNTLCRGLPTQFHMDLGFERSIKYTYSASDRLPMLRTWKTSDIAACQRATQQMYLCSHCWQQFVLFLREQEKALIQFGIMQRLYRWGTAPCLEQHLKEVTEQKSWSKLITPYTAAPLQPGLGGENEGKQMLLREYIKSAAMPFQSWINRRGKSLVLSVSNKVKK